jgi:hypothetical protein
MWPGAVEADVTQFNFFRDVAGLDVFGRTTYKPASSGDKDSANDKLDKGTGVLFHHPFNVLGVGEVSFLNKKTKEYYPASRQEMYYRDLTDVRAEHSALKPLRYVKFPRLHFDPDSSQIILFYWTNVPAIDLQTTIDELTKREADTGTDTTNDELNFSIVEKAAEPLLVSGSVDTSLQRILVFTKGRVFNLYDDQTGAIRHQPSTIIFERPRMLFRPDIFDVGNQGEPVLDVHPESSTFIEFFPIA